MKSTRQGGEVLGSSPRTSPSPELWNFQPLWTELLQGLVQLLLEAAPWFHVSEPVLSLVTCPGSLPIVRACPGAEWWEGPQAGSTRSGKLGTSWGDVLSLIPLADICFIALKSFSEG